MTPHCPTPAEAEAAVITLSLVFAASCGVPHREIVFVPAEVGAVEVASAPNSPASPGPRMRVAALVVELGESFPLTSLLTTADPTARARTRWVSSQPSVASVDPASGQLTGRSEGMAEVIATDMRIPNAQSHLTVTVKTAHLVRQITVTPSALTIAVGERRHLLATVQMASGELHGNVTWSSSDTTRAIVNATTGEVTALGEGRVTIRAAYRLNPKYAGLAELSVHAPGGPVPASAAPVASPSPTPDMRLPQNRPPARPVPWW
ncbi:Bacterial Ig-like domain (group 2) [compost metagenome]